MRDFMDTVKEFAREEGGELDYVTVCVLSV